MGDNFKAKQNNYTCVTLTLNACQGLYIQALKTFLKMLNDVGMAVPKTTATRCRDGRVQARHVIQRQHK